MAADNSLKILHVLRAPVGGLFRHVLDLARGQIARGHHVGLIADVYTGGAWAEQRLAELAPALALGISRIAMSRQIGLSDISAAKQVARRAAEMRADVVHGHGAKGGAYARLVPSGRAIRAYTPHGGSLHFSWSSLAGFSYLASERFLARRTELFLFESEYGCSVFERKLGRPRALARVVHNGIGPEEFAAIAPQPGASDVVFVGELRLLKGIDVLIEAIAALRRRGKSITATIVGEGPQRQVFAAAADARGLGQKIRFVGARPARTAFALGRILVVPSRAESLPYVVLEAAAAQVPMISTGVGGISEIFGPDSASLIPAGDAGALTNAIESTLSDQATARALAQRLQERVRTLFSLDAMTEAVLAAYEEALAAR